MSNSAPAEKVDLAIDSLAAGGDGVGRDGDGRVVFVPRTAPGDRVRVALLEDRGSFARARLEALIEPGPGRVEPECALFAAGSCGGCQWLHLDIETQRSAKVELAASALRHLIAGGLELLPLSVPTPPLRWRRTARLHWFRPRGSARAIVGFTAPRSRRITDVEVCLQLAPELEAAAVAIRSKLAPGLVKRGEIDLVLGAEGVLVRVAGPVSRRVLAELGAEAGIAGVRGRGPSIGAESVDVEPGVAVRAGDFVQASAAGNRALVDIVADWAGAAPGRVLELFAGSGNFTRRLCEGADSVVAVDRGAGPRVARDNLRWHRAAAAAATARLATAGEHFDLVVLDPPRTGARDIVAPLAALAPSRIVYVSCDPATLARDAAALAERGYRATRAQPLDLMPQTSHVEIVLELVRARA